MNKKIYTLFKTGLLAMTLFILQLSSVNAQTTCNANFTVQSNGQGTVTFGNQSSGNFTVSQWSFGDGTGSTLTSPVHTFSQTGTYIVCLTIHDSLQTCNSTFCDSVHVTVAGSGCQAAFSYQQANQNTFNFTDASSPQTPFVYWNFGDGTTSNLHNPTHSYTSAGTFNVCLTIIDSLLGCSNSYCSQVTVQGSGNCQANFNASVDSTGGVNFTDASTGNPSHWAWSFGDGSAGTGQNVFHQYNSTGYHYVCLTISDSASGCQSTYCDTVLTGGQAQCTADFNFNLQGNNVFFTGYLTGNYTSFYWSFGDGTSSTLLNPQHTYANAGTYNVCLTSYDANQNICGQHCATVVVTTQTNSTLCGTIFWDTNGNGLQDAGENGIAGGYVVMYGNGFFASAISDSLGYYYASVPAGNYQVYYCTQYPGVFTVPQADTAGCGLYLVTVGASQTLCGLNFGLQNTSVIIEGTIFNDANNNGAYDSGEAGIPYQGLSVGAYYAYTDANGHYSIHVPAGTYTVSYTPSGIYTGYTVTTASSINVNASTIGNTYGNNNFGIYIVPGSTDLYVTIIPHTTVTPGFPAWYDVQVCNIGASATGATLTFNYDAGLVFSYANPAESSINTSTHQITWNLPVIAPGSCSYIWLDFDAITSLNIGDATFELAHVVPTSGTDINMANNTDTIHQIVTGSWDPNNKLSIRTNTQDPNLQQVSSVNPDQYIEYTVNFQNTGTGPAVNVTLLDELSADLDASTFELTGVSHNGTVTRNGNQLNFSFSNIMLPASSVNEPESHGFVAFRVKALNGLAAGHVISDNAAIYFDFNAPVITNFAEVTMVNALGVNENTASLSHVSVYPNPVVNETTLVWSLEKAADVKISVIDLQGKLLETAFNANQSAGTHSLVWNADKCSKGIYMLKIEANGTTGFARINVVK